MIPLVGVVALQAASFQISALDLTPMTNGWSRPGVDRSISGGPLRIGGSKFTKGIGAHANARLDLRLSNATAFEARVGVDDATEGKGSVEFLVVVDGTVRWRSGVMRGGQAPKNVHVDLRGAKTLSLRATDAGDGSGYDHADWADARITTSGTPPMPVRDLHPIRIEAGRAALHLFVDEGRLRQRAFGAKDADETEGQLAYPTSGDGWTFEPALEVRHADGNTSTDLRVVRTSSENHLTRIELKDAQYPLHVDLFFRAYPGQDVIETWTEVRHEERGTVTLDRFASSAPDFGKGEFWLTQFTGDWNREAEMVEERLTYGLKLLDSKLGVRAHQFRAPWFLLAKGGPAKEDVGEVFGGSLAWSGSFALAFEMGAQGRLRATCGVNPYASTRYLRAGERFTSPPMVWAWSGNGTGELTRKLHRWTRTHLLRDGNVPRSILLNNWEATYFDFDERKIVSLFEGAKDLGMEMFLLDDGWFGRKYPRDGDTQGLGDWIPAPKKLPNGLGALTDAAKAKGLRFGLWFEPEMVNPKSELFERHPDWLIQQPKRPFDLTRNQMVLDLSNPTVKEYAFRVVDETLTKHPGITYVKWDCNRFITQPGSPYLPKDRQSHLWVDYVHNLYEIMDRLAKRHPKVEIMMCAGGGGRVDYGAMRYAHELWPSDNTDPAKRIFIQWGYSHFFPALAVSNHVTHTGGHGFKLAFDVAMSGRMGMDIDVSRLSAEERAFAKSAIATYKEIRDVVQLGELYRLESPYAGPRSALMHTHGDRAVVFVYALGETAGAPLKLKGLVPTKRYRIREINLAPGQVGFTAEARGEDLINDGLLLPAFKPYGSAVYELRAQP